MAVPESAGQSRLSVFGVAKMIKIVNYLVLYLAKECLWLYSELYGSEAK